MWSDDVKMPHQWVKSMQMYRHSLTVLSWWVSDYDISQSENVPQSLCLTVAELLANLHQDSASHFRATFFPETLHQHFILTFALFILIVCFPWSHIVSDWQNLILTLTFFPFLVYNIHTMIACKIKFHKLAGRHYCSFQFQYCPCFSSLHSAAE